MWRSNIQASEEIQIYLELNIPNIINFGKSKICDQFHAPATLTPLIISFSKRTFKLRTSKDTLSAVLPGRTVFSQHA